ncbi:MAG: hypothetical protein ACOY5U_13920 [Pseudomonadota bacterium]
MVLVSHRHDFIFLKTRKTAGTSVEMALEPFCRPEGAAIVEATPTLVSPEGIVGRRLTRPSLLQRLRLKTDWWNHMTADQVRARLGEATWGRCRKVTTVRNPFDIAVSRFHWELARHGTPEAADFSETRARFNAMLRQRTIDCDRDIVHSRGRLVTDLVVRYEHLGEDLARVMAELVPGAPLPEIAHTKKTSGRRRRPLADYFDSASIDAIRRSAGWVFDRFDYPDHPADLDRNEAVA